MGNRKDAATRNYFELPRLDKKTAIPVAAYKAKCPICGLVCMNALGLKKHLGRKHADDVRKTELDIMDTFEPED